MLESASLAAAMADGSDKGLYKHVVIWQFESPYALEALRARANFVARLRERAGAPVDALAAKIIFSELVGNVVCHAPGPIAITVAIHGSFVTIRVDDTGPGFVLAPSLPSDPHSEAGRGLFLISRFAAGVWAQPRAGGGTSVLAALALAGPGTRDLEDGVELGYRQDSADSGRDAE